MHEDDSTHKRHGLRFQAGLPAVLHAEAGDRPCRAHDLSRSGVLLRGEMEAPPGGGRVRVTLRNPAGDLEVTLEATVNRAEQVEPGSWQLGLGFGPLEDERRQVLDALVARVVEGFVPAQLERLSERSSVAEIRATLEEIPVAHRVSLAARASLKHRALLRHDTNLQVLESLARNPHSSPPEIKALLRLRRLTPRTLEIVAGDPRWARDEDIRVAVVTHAAVTVSLAQRVAAKLGPQGVQRALRHPSLPAPVKNQLLARGSKKPGW